MKRRLLALAVVLVVASPFVIAADESVSAARDLYAAAAYEDALLLLNRLRSSGRGPDEARAIEQYRAFCLLALGRRDDAEQAIAAVVAGAPSYHPSEAEASPRVRSAFSEVRRRMLPTITQEKYAAAKAAYDRKELPAAADGFKQVLDLLADPDLGQGANQPPLSDLRTLAKGFYDLSASVPTAPPAPVPLPGVPALPTAAVPQVPAPVRGHVYGAEDPTVMAPVALKQVLPPFQYQTAAPPHQGMLEIVIAETGNVVAVVMRTSIHPKYDAAVIDAARSWRYKPATLQGVPVMYRKIVAITVKPGQ
jgi:hypothetical protein